MTADQLTVEDWDVWHNYSSYLTVEKLDLSKVAYCLTASGVAELCFHRDGEVWWRENDRVAVDRCDFISSPDFASHKILFPKALLGKNALGYAGEAIYQGVYFSLEEWSALRPDEDMPQAYIRAFMAPVQMHSDHRNLTILAYPMLKIFENGIVFVTFRFLAPSRKIDHTEFLKNYVNCSFIRWDSVKVPPAISELAPLSYAMTHGRNSLANRLINYIRYLKHKKVIGSITDKRDTGDFEFSFAPLVSEADRSDTISDIAQTIFSIVGYVVGRGESVGWFSSIRNSQNLPLPGKRWFGRPTIFLLKFDGQEDCSSDNSKKFASQFASLLARSKDATEAINQLIASKDLRLSEDFSFFAASSGFLVVWAGSGVERYKEISDRNRGELIYKNQALIELVAYGDMLHHRILNECDKSSEIAMVHKYRKDLVRFEVQRNHASSYGEVKDLLAESWNALGLSKMRHHLADAISIKEDELSLKENRNINYIGIFLAVLFGVVGAPGLAQGVTKPIWILLGFPRFSPPMFFDLCMTLMTIVLLVLICLIAVRGIKFLAHTSS